MNTPDGNVACDRCRTQLTGFGVLQGMITSEYDLIGNLVNRIFCYENECRSDVLRGLVVHSEAGPDYPVCTHCGAALPEWSPTTAVLAVDASSAGQQRPMAFCIVGGCSRLLSDRSGSVVTA